MVGAVKQKNGGASRKTRPQRVAIRMTAEEKKMLDEMAAEMGWTASSWVRTVVRRSYERRAFPAVERAFRAQENRMFFVTRDLDEALAAREGLAETPKRKDARVERAGRKKGS
jgi:uncharacterized protein (DUF1778 family)